MAIDSAIISLKRGRRTLTLAELEATAIRYALDEYRHMERTAQALGISRSTLHRKVKEYGIMTKR